VPPNQTSVFGFAFSAMICASASPEPLSDMLTLMPVVLANTVWIMLHHSACTEQMTLSWPASWAAAGATAAATAAAMVKVRKDMGSSPVVTELSSRCERWALAPTGRPPRGQTRCDGHGARPCMSGVRFDRPKKLMHHLRRNKVT
jgi:hypothetical protein